MLLLRRAFTTRSPTGNVPPVQRKIDTILENNRKWVDTKTRSNPNFFSRFEDTHKPEYLWIGCSDARVPADRLLGQDAGTVFVHRNIANQVQGIDANTMSVLQYGVDVLKVKHVIVCGHYECGGVKAAMQSADHASPLEDWLRSIRDVYRLHHEELDQILDEKQRYRRLTELNVVEQTLNVFKTAVVQRNRVRTVQDPSEPFPTPQVHGMIYDPTTGELTELDVNFNSYLKTWEHLYALYSREGLLPLPPADPSMLHDESVNVMRDSKRCAAMKATFSKYARGDGTLGPDKFGEFLEQELETKSTQKERKRALKLLGAKQLEQGVTFMQLVGWWSALENKSGSAKLCLAGAEVPSNATNERSSTN
eukprot:TRINITY_DN21468_c0_g1_i1.p1 TRINITY_DN21468_c0_g1~~TRINITY_DN21468_c0_g1_i1.p1  ORF type:complete len:365 (-),score=77.79 TRINITY_DN21468_c0_g1_i1:113-1207(-)